MSRHRFKSLLHVGFIWLIIAGFVMNVGCQHESAENQLPIAIAGEDQTVAPGSQVNLDGTASSDIETPVLRFNWVIVDKPKGSNTLLSEPAGASPFFIADRVGRYIMQLVVFDGLSYSEADHVTVIVQNGLPMAVASFTSFDVGEAVQLDASLSSDPDGEPLTYEWLLSSTPPTSQAVIVNNTLMQTQFIADIHGQYIVHLLVNDGFQNSDPAKLIIEIGAMGQPPVAEAGNDIALFKARQIRLDGSLSFDPDGEIVTYQWRFLKVPIGAFVQLDDDRSAIPQFDVNVLGGYVLQLVVRDSLGESYPDTVLITYHKNPDRPCGDCHDGRHAPGMNEGHLTLRDDCGVCHMPENWKPVKGVPVHLTVPETCDNCHVAKGIATAKSANHRQTENDCKDCHSVDAWTPANIEPLTPLFDHRGLTSGCNQCHVDANNGKRLNHIPSSDLCSACHSTDQWIPALHLEHTDAFRGCSICHDNKLAKGKPSHHIRSSAKCDQCHVKYRFKPVVTVNHNETQGNCVSCHDGKLAEGKGAQHPESSNACDECHSVVNWMTIVRIQAHAGVIDQCDACHNDSQALGKLDGPKGFHLETSVECEACHRIVSWLPLMSVDHREVIGECKSCHVTPPEQLPSLSTRGENHIATSDQCGACHVTNVWLPTFKVAHTEVFGDCILCHDGETATGWSDNHVASSKLCAACHATKEWVPVVVMDHDEITNQNVCFDCHNGTLATGQPETHMPTSTSCKGCHATRVWTPNVIVDHNEVLGRCLDCHNEELASGKVRGHQPTTNNCTKCHMTSRWTPVYTVDHTQVVGECVICHQSPLNHVQVGVRDQCEDCHITKWWAEVIKPLPKN